MGTIYEVKVDVTYQDKLQKLQKEFRFHRCEEKHTYFATGRALELSKQKDIPVSILRTLNSETAGINIIRPFPSIIMNPPNDDAIDEVVALALSKVKAGKLPAVVYLGRGTNIKTDKDAFILDRAGSRRRYSWR